MILAGIDEAGYGPLLGPLVVSATAFELIDVPLPTDADKLPCLWRMLKSAVAKKAPEKKGRLIIADSKIVHHLTDGTRLLERGVLAFHRCMADSPATNVTALLEHFGCTNHGLTGHQWYAPDQLPIPWMAESGDLAIACNVLTAALAAAKIKIAAMRTAVVSEGNFNRLVGNTQNKASALVSITLTHLYHLHATYGHLGLIVGIDKQGGRDHYTSLLLQSFPDAQLKVLLESPKASIYFLQESGPDNSRRQTIVHFREKGESHFLPTALASMICKYLRELCMHSFNAWWCAKITGLRPTAGYHQDGTRWLTDVDPHLTRLGIDRDLLVRIR